MITDIMIWVLSAIGAYISVVWLMVYFKERGNFSAPHAKRIPYLSIIIPAYNEEKNIESTIKSVLSSDYPKNKLEVVLVNDGSTDNTKKLAEKYSRRGLIRLINQKNSGKGAALNNALRTIRGELFGVVDADTTLDKDTLKKLVGFFNSKSVGAAISAIKPAKSQKILEKFQKMEYLLAILARKLMDKLDTNYVTPGALSIYRRDAVINVGGFDEKNITEDLEMGLRLRANGYTIKASIDAFTYTKVPNTLKKFFKQRLRWNRGFLINCKKYKNIVLNPRFGYLGTYQLLIGLISILLIIPVGFGLGSYFLYKAIYSNYLYFSSVGFRFPNFFSFQSLESFFLGFDIKHYYPLIVTASLATMLLHVAHKITNESYRTILSIVLVIMFYYPLLGILWILALLAEILGIRPKW